MAKVKIQGHASGTGILTVTAPNTDTDRTITLPDGTGTLIADDGSGNVGIGTTSPSEKLHVQGDGADILITDDGNGQTCKLGATGSNNGLLELNNSSHTAKVFLTSSGDSYLNGGNVGIGTSSPSNYLHVKADPGNTWIARFHNESGTNSPGIVIQAQDSASLNYSLLRTYTSATGDIEHNLRGDGNAYCDGSWSGGGADYAEYFEWSDGNASNEDRRGFSVVLDGDKIRPAVDGDSPIGVISGRPVVIGDNDIDRWKQKYLRDDFGAYIWESKTHTVWQEQVIDDEGVESEIKKEFQSDRIPANETVPDNAVVKTEDEEGRPLIRRKLNPEWNEDEEYISREDRPEWDTVGLMGKIRILKGQPVDSRWIKMRDVSDTVEEWLIR